MSESGDIFSLDDLEEPGPIADLASTSLLSSNANSGDPLSSSSSPPLIGSSNLFSETNPGSNDDSSIYFENDENDSPFAVTDATLLSGCATDQSLMDERQPLLAARDDNSCSRPPGVPLSPDTLQLFEDPLGWLKRVTTPTNSDPSAPSPSVQPGVEPGYPGLLDPEEQARRAKNPGGLWHNTDPVGGEYWHDYEGEVIYGTDDDEYRHCHMYRNLGYIYALCCRKARTRLAPMNLPEYYPMLEECDPNVGMSISTKIPTYFSLFFSLNYISIPADRKCLSIIGTYCETEFDVCCRRHVSHLFTLFFKRIRRFSIFQRLIRTISNNIGCGGKRRVRVLGQPGRDSVSVPSIEIGSMTR